MDGADDNLSMGIALRWGEEMRGMREMKKTIGMAY